MWTSQPNRPDCAGSDPPDRDVIEYLKDLHGIEIQIDKKALDDVGVQPDTPVTRTLKGISLRSALRLTLKDLDLTDADSEFTMVKRYDLASGQHEAVQKAVAHTSSAWPSEGYCAEMS